MFLNDKTNLNSTKCRSVNVGNVRVSQERSEKLLGVTIDDTQNWNSEVYGKGGLLSNLNSRQFMVKRINNQINRECNMKMVNSLYNSKLRYGVPLYGQIRWTEDETSSKIFSDIQLNQNRMMRSLNHSKISDKIRTKTIFEKYNMLSVNQINAQVKLNDMWKANNVAITPQRSGQKQDLVMPQQQDLSPEGMSSKEQIFQTYQDQHSSMMQQKHGIELQTLLKIAQLIILPKKV